MLEPQIKKLITGFLVLATLTSSSAFALSEYLTSRADDYKKVPVANLSNAFSKTPAENLADINKGGGNLTMGLADFMAQKVVNINPSGPNQINGQEGVDLPDIQKSIDEYASQISIDLKDFAIPQEKIHIKKGSTAEDTQIYLRNVTDILKKSFEGSEAKNLEEKLKKPNEEVLNAYSLFFAQIEDQISTLETPEQTLEFHKDLLTYLGVPQKSLEQIQTDPLKTLILLENSGRLMQDQGAKILSDLNILKSQKTTPTSSFLQNFFGVKTAYAFLGFGDIVFDPLNYIPTWASWLIDNAEWIQKVYDAAKQIILEKLKDALLKRITNAVLNWAGASGNPKFITNWGSFLSKTYYAAAGELLAQRAKNYCSVYRDQMVENLKNINGIKDLNMGSGGLGCTLEQTVSNMETFYEDFSDGGWDAFTEASMPENNPQMALFFESQTIGAAAEAAKHAAELKTLAGNGWQSTERCDNGQAPVNGVCEDKSTPQVTTPGNIIGDLTSKVLIEPQIQRIVNIPTDKNSNGWQTFVTQIVTYGVTKLMDAGLNGLSHGGITDSKAPDKYSVCSGYKTGSKEYLDCLEGVNKSVPPPDGSGTKKNLLDLVSNEIKNAESTFNYLQLSETAASSSIDILNNIISLNCTQTSQAQAELPTLTQEYADILKKMDSTMSKMDALGILLEKVNNTEDDETLTELMNQFLSDYAANGMTEMSEAQIQSEMLQRKLEEASGLLTQCLSQ